MTQDTAADGRVDTQALAEAFCIWPLPVSVRSDECATIPEYPNRSGTNLLTVAEAKVMFDHLVERGLIGPSSPPAAGDSILTRLRTLSDAATPGLWEDDTYSDEDGSGRYDARQVINQDERTLFDTSNSEVKLIDHDYDGEGLGSSWDEQGARDIKFVVALVDAFRSGQLVAAAALSPAAGGPVSATRWRHVKRGTTYTEIGRADLQKSGTLELREGDKLIVYCGDDGRVWVREAREFEDGHFERIAASDRAQVQDGGGANPDNWPEAVEAAIREHSSPTIGRGAHDGQRGYTAYEGSIGFIAARLKTAAPSAPAPAVAAEPTGLDFLNWVGAIESYDDAIVASAASLARHRNYLKTDKDVARHVLWTAGVDHMWKHIAALRRIRSNIPAPAVAGDAEPAFIGWKDPAPHAARGPGIQQTHEMKMYPAGVAPTPDRALREAGLGQSALVAMPWKTEDTAPQNLKLVTYRTGESDVATATLRVWPDGDREWIAPDGRTTVTHHSYAPPTHWLCAAPCLPNERTALANHGKGGADDAKLG